MNSIYGRLVFGVSAVLFGVICLMWHDFDTWQSVFRILAMPGGHIVGNLLMIALIVGGIAIVIPATIGVGARILAVVFGLFAITCIVGVFTHPKMFAEYDTVAEQLSMLSGAIAVISTTAAIASRTATLRLIARLGYGISLVSFMLAQIIYYGDTAPLVPKWLPPSQAFWAWTTTVAFGLAAVAVLLNIRARLALGLTAFMLAVFGLVVWVPALIAKPGSHNDWSEFTLNALIMGAAWLVAAVAGNDARARLSV
jgi:hypothetical protein